MKYIDEFRDGTLARAVARAIAAEAHPRRVYHLMEFCGGHTHTIYRYGITDLLPANIRMIHGPGCPVCVLPMGRIDAAIELAGKPEMILCSYADMLRVPGAANMSLMRARGRGADVRMLYSPADALTIARENPHREVVFFAIGFETTAPPTAMVVQEARRLALDNFTVFCNHVLTPPAMRGILAQPDVLIDGFVGPGHVSAVIGKHAYEFAASEYRKPVVIAGFEPLDLMRAVQLLVRQINEGRAEVENEYSRAVADRGNPIALRLMEEVFETRPDFEWRGLGSIPRSGLRLRNEFAAFDAERRFELSPAPVSDHKACECADILRGVKQPADCKVFAKACTPDSPLGACMVSSEGACAAYYAYGRHRNAGRGP